MRATHWIVAAALALSLGACGQTTATTETAAEPEVAAVEPAAAGACAVIANRNWTAHINAMPGPNAQRTLIVAGEVDLPTPGYTVTLDLGIADRSAMPTQQLVINTTAPTGIVPHIVTAYPVNYSGPAIAAQYTAVRIMCGGQQLAEMQVTVAQ